MPARASSRRPPVQLTCVACGYDLRGLPAVGRCPECGTSIAESAASMRLDCAPIDWLIQREGNSRALEQTLRLPSILSAIAMALGTLLVPALGPAASVPAGALAFMIVVLLPMALTLGIASMAAATPERRSTARLAPWRRRTVVLARAAFFGWMLGLLCIFCAPPASVLSLFAALSAIALLSDSYPRYLGAVARIAARPALAARLRRQAWTGLVIAGIWASVNVAIILGVLGPPLPGWFWGAIGGDLISAVVIWCIATGVFFIWLYRLGPLQRHITAALRHARRRAETGVMRRAANASAPA